MPHIQTIAYDNAEEELKATYDHIIKSRGKLADVHKIQSLNPKALMAHMELYMAVMFGKSPLKRYQREMIGVVVSVANRCRYCIQHHEQALLAYWKDPNKTHQLKGDRSGLDLSEKDEALCRFAEILTFNGESDYSSQIEHLKQKEFSDRAVLDAVQVIAYFNFVNRLVLGLGVSTDKDEMKGYRY